MVSESLRAVLQQGDPWPDPRSHADIVAGLPIRRFQRDAAPEGTAPVEAVQLTEDNLMAVCEWVGPSKPRYLAGRCVGLTLRPGADRIAVLPGDWVVHGPGGGWFRFPGDVFAASFTPLETP